MASKVLIIDGDDRGQFFLMVEGQTLYVGDNATHADLLPANLRVKRIHCELEVDDAPPGGPTVPNAPDSHGMNRNLAAGTVMQFGHVQVRLEEIVATEDETPALAPVGDASIAKTPAPADAAPSTAGKHKQFCVIDGPDKGLKSIVPESGIFCIGKSQRHAEIVLHDLYVSRVHCELENQGDFVLVTHMEGQDGTLINGQKITGPHELRIGDVLRIGNSHLRLEMVSEAEFAEVPEIETEVVEEPPPAPVDPFLGLENELLGHFQLQELLSRDCAGAIFRGQDLKTKQAVSLQVLPPEFPATPAELQHLVQALKVAQNLHHANLVPQHGAGRSGRFCWIARSLIEGQNLTAQIKPAKAEGEFKWKRAGRLAVHLARALAFLEKNKVVQRDLSPPNILMRDTDRAFLLTDVMLTDALAGSQLAAALAKQPAILPFRAPEQLEHNGAIDVRTSLYGLGASIYGVLTGQPPFNGKTTDEFIDHIRKDKPIKPTKVQPTIPSSFEAVVLKLLAKAPDDRYQSAAALLVDVEKIARENEIKL